MTIRRVVLATRNAGKLRELRPIFAEACIEAIDLDEAGIPESASEDELEVHETFEENALAKARWFASRSAGLPVVADDSGLEVSALGGQPGVRSKRWSGHADLSGQALYDANNARLLAELAAASDRTARFVCAAAYVDVERELVIRGETAGVILTAAAGSGGFGYDPLFFSPELRMSFGEASTEAKQAVSHRGRAFRELVRRI